jgi:glycosyltransferase involved in cell wall biosynthesis
MRQALYSVMLWFLEHPEERERMAKNSRRMIIDRFDQKMIFRELQKVYNVLAS